MPGFCPWSLSESFPLLEAGQRPGPHPHTGLTPGSTVAACVIAANPGGEAAPSPTVTKVVGA